MQNTFTKKHTNMLKGVATLLLLFHHLFYKLEYFDTCYIFTDTWVNLLREIAVHSKVCVAIFLLLSGYGLYKSASKLHGDITFRFSLQHIFKILTMLWFVYILFVPIGFFFGRRFSLIYGTGIWSILHIFADLMGMTSRANETWWYFRELLFLYTIFPLLFYGAKKNGLLLFIVSLALTIGHYFEWILPFVTGMLLAEKEAFTPIFRLHRRGKLLLAGASLLSMFLFLVIRIFFGMEYDTFFALSIIVFVSNLISADVVIGRCLGFIGIHSANIFMFHTFIYSKYFRSQIFWFKYPLLIFLVLTLICVAVSVGIEALKKLIRYERLNQLIQSILTQQFSKRQF